MKTGFVISRLTLSGRSVPAAEVLFRGGLNVIAGPSDTGKTFIFQCLDFVMGGSTSPKEIPEASAYDSIQVEVRSRSDDKTYTLDRGLRGGEVHLKGPGVDGVLLAKHVADRSDTVSFFLLQLSGLTGKKVKTNIRGNTRPLSFRDVIPLILIDEEAVIQDSSPVLSGQYITKTAEAAVFRLILTGMDDSAVIAQPDPKVAKGKQEGKAELLLGLLKRTQSQIDEMKIEGNVEQIRTHLSHLESVIEMASKELSSEQGSITDFENRRRNAWTRLREVDSRLDLLAELQKRFVLLQVQYSSDLQRLEAILEAGVRLEQMKEERCPVCGAASEFHSTEHTKLQESPEEVANSCRAEAEKIKRLISDLNGTLEANAVEIKRLRSEKAEKETELASTAGELKAQLQPRLQEAIQNLKEAQERRDAYRRVVELYDLFKEYDSLLLKAQSKQKKERADGTSSAVKASEAELFSQEVESLLKAWHFPELDRVTYSEGDQDVVVSGRSRGSHGKGVRAVIRAAFNLALLRYCIRYDKPSPGLVLIDSPLVVYREPDANENEFPYDVKDSFYKAVAADFKNAQVIVLENDDPPKTLQAEANIIRFTGTDNGRKGFIPQGT